MLSIIAAVDKNGNIGLKGDMPWGKTMKADLQRFKELTNGKTIIMGRKTFESLPGVLPNRKHVVITSEYKRDVSVRPVFYVQSCDEAWDFTKYEHQSYWGKEHEGEVFIIGGAQVYNQFMPYADRIYITQILETFEGDTKFPEITGDWEVVERSLHPADENNPYPYEYITYEKK